MSLLTPNGDGAVIVRAADAEVVGEPPTTVRLLADASSTGGALTSQRVTLATGADGATPHHHAHATELFYVLGGAVQVLAGESVNIANEGDLIVVPPNIAHAFAAPPESEADLLIVLTPGIERFEYFRLLARLARGEATLDELLESQDLYDNHFLDSPAWRAAREHHHDPG
jgi:quercetin dioxygenase-like cupin family protein